jgi:protein N-terminal amidase
MRIATLQFAPKLGDVDGNIQRANELLKKGKSITLGDQTLPIGIGVDLMRPDVLVLPELALTGMYLTKIRVDVLQSTDRV